MNNGSRYSMRGDGKQVYLSASVNRHLGMPEDIALYTAEDDEKIDILLIDKENVPDFDLPTIGVVKKRDADGVRLTRFPFELRTLMGTRRFEAIEINDDGSIVFSVPKEATDDSV